MIFVEGGDSPINPTAPAGQYVAPHPGRRALFGVLCLQRYRTSGAEGREGLSVFLQISSTSGADDREVCFLHNHTDTPAR